MGENTETYRRLVELSPDGLLISQGGFVVFANPAAARLCGAAQDDILGRAVFDLFVPGTGLWRDHLACVMDGRTVAPFEHQIVQADGAIIDVEVALTRLDEPGAPPAIVWTLHEISERKRADTALRESEERLTLAFAGAQEGVWDWNLVTGDVVYSPRWKQMLGYADHEIEPHVSAWERLLHPEDMARAQEVNESVARGARAYEGEFRLRHKDGHYVQVLSRGYPVRREPGGPVVRIVGTHFDLTERRQAEAERARTELLSRLVFAQEDERRRIAREMHDQFGEQLTALNRGIAALQEACGESPELAGHVQALEKIARQIDRDVDQLVWQLRPTALDDLGLRAALANYVLDWSRRVSIPAELHTSGLLDERLSPDAETTLYRIAQEALTNVAKHSRASRVDVILERQADSVRLIVEDDGVGFDASRDRHGEDDRPEMDSACSECRSARPWSARRSRSNRQQGKAPRSSCGWPSPAPLRRNQKLTMNELTTTLRVLLADDHVTVRHGLRLLIDGQPDMKVIAEASDGTTAIQRALDLKPDVVVMDISMPGMNGLVATRTLKQARPHLAVITLTRHGDDAYLQELLRAGVSGYVLKQSAPSELLQAIRVAGAGGQYLDSTLTAKVTAGFLGREGKRVGRSGAQITDRESEVLRLIASGYSNKEIAARLDLSVKTVEAHKSNAMRKLGLTGRIDIVKYAILQGWMDNA